MGSEVQVLSGAPYRSATLRHIAAPSKNAFPRNAGQLFGDMAAPIAAVVLLDPQDDGPWLASDLSRRLKHLRPQPKRRMGQNEQNIINKATMAHQNIESATPLDRIQQNILAKSERKLLAWLCNKMPGWVNPDLLTGLGVFGATATFAGYVASNAGKGWLWLAIAGYIIHWFGDSMDGSLARFRHIERPRFGYFIDHSCDGIAIFLILTGVGLSPFVRMDVALIALVGYLLLCVHAFLAARVVGEMKLSYLAAGPTELRLVLIGLTVAMMALGSGPRLFAPLSGFDLFVGSVGVVLILLFLAQTLITARRLAAED